MLNTLNIKMTFRTDGSMQVLNVGHNLTALSLLLHSVSLKKIHP